MKFFGPLIYFLLANATMVIITKKKFGKVLPLTMIASVAALFFSQFIFKTFNIGIVACLVFGIYSVIYLIKNKNARKKFYTNYLSNGFYAFIILYIMVFIFNINRYFSQWDEFSHWGEMIKEMFRLDDFYTAKNSVLQAHKDYPPAISLFEYLWCKLTLGYSESSLISSVHMFELSLFIPAIYEKIKISKKNTIISSSLIFMIAFLTISFFDQHGVINSIYIDYAMAILPAYCIFFIIFEKDITSNFSLVNLSFCLSFLLLTKQMGLPFYMIVLFVYLSKLIFDSQFKFKSNKKRLLIMFIAVILIPLLAWKGWDIYVNTIFKEQQFKFSDIKLTELLSILKKEGGEPYQIVAASNFLNALYSTNISSFNINLNYFQSVILSLVLIYFVYVYGRKYISKKSFIITECAVIIGAVGYAFTMLLLYVFNFGPVEGPNLASYNRYMDTYIIFMLSISLMYFIRIITIKNKKNILFVMLALMLVLASPGSIKSYAKNLEAHYPSVYETDGRTINKYTKNGKVFIVAQNSIGDYQFFTKYYANPIIVNMQNFNLEKENVTEKYKNKIKREILKYDYVYLANLDETFKDNYEYLFENSDDIKNKCLYKVNTKKQKIKLEGC